MVSNIDDHDNDSVSLAGERAEAKERNGERDGVERGGVHYEGITVSHEEARRLFELGIKADPTHGPLYNAYGCVAT